MDVTPDPDAPATASRARTKGARTGTTAASVEQGAMSSAKDPLVGRIPAVVSVGDPFGGREVEITRDETAIAFPRGKHVRSAAHIIEPRSMIDLRERAQEVMDKAKLHEACIEFLSRCDLDPTPDAVDQLEEVFLPCLRIMCERPWDPNGGTWRRSGILGVLTDARKKFERFWERTWTHGQRHDDSGLDLINFVGFVMRADPQSRWNEWGEPGETEQ